MRSDLHDQLLTENASLAASQSLLTGLATFISEVQRQSTLSEKLKRICKAVVRLEIAGLTSVLLFDEELTLEHTSFFVKHNSDLEAVEKVFAEKFKIGTRLNRKFYQHLFSPTHAVSESYVASMPLISQLMADIQSGEPVVMYMEQTDTAEVKDATIFTPLYNRNGGMIGYLSSALDTVPDDLKATVQRIELYARIIEKDIELFRNYESELRRGEQVSRMKTRLQDLFNFSAAISQQPSVEQKVRTMAESITKAGDFKSCIVVLYRSDGSLEHTAFAGSGPGTPDADTVQANLTEVQHTQKKVLDQIFSTAAFRVENSYCFTPEQVAALTRFNLKAFGDDGGRIALPHGEHPLRSLPPESWPMTLGEENLRHFGSDEPVGLFTPIQTGGITFGYVGLGEPKEGMLGTDDLRERLKMISLFIDEVASDIFQKKLEQDRERYAALNLTIRDLLETLFAAGNDVQSAATVQEKFKLAADSIVNSFGFQEASLIAYDEHYVVTDAAFSMNPATHNEEDYARHRAHIYTGKQLTRKAFEVIHATPEFVIGGCRCYHVRQVAKLMGDEKPNFIDLRGHSPKIDDHDPALLSPTAGLDNLVRYLNGDTGIGIMFTLCDETGNSVGSLSLGDLMPSFSDITVPEFIERLRIIAIFIERLSQDYLLARLAAERKRELSEKNRLNHALSAESKRLQEKNRFIQTLLELGVQLSQPITRQEKIKITCERIVSGSVFKSVTGIVVRGGDYLITDFCVVSHPALAVPVSYTQPAAHAPAGMRKLNQRFVELSFAEETRIGHSHCYDLHWLYARTDAVNDKPKYVIREGVATEFTDIHPHADYLTHAEAFDVFCGLRGGYDASQINFLIPMRAAEGTLLGFISLGGLLEGVRKTRDEALEEISLIELIAGNLASSLATEQLTADLSASEAKYKNIVENVSYGFIAADRSGVIEYINPFLRTVLGYSEAEMLGKPYAAFVSAESVPVAIDHFRKYLSRFTATEYEIRLQPKQGGQIPFRISATPQVGKDQAGEMWVKGAFGVLVDLRQQKKVEEQQKALETIQDNFFAMVIHDLKVPLSAIYGYSQLLSDLEPNSIDPARYHNIVSQIHLSSENITRLVQDILDFSKFESHKVSLQKVRQSLLLATELVAEQVHHDLAGKQLTIERRFTASERELTFDFDFDKIVRVINNLIGNAIKFSNPKTSIHLSLSRRDEGESCFAVFRIEDQGDGMSEEEVGYIFDAYRQANSKHGSRGTGLGLSIAEQIIDLHGGYIRAESKLGRGTVIEFGLPM